MDGSRNGEPPDAPWFDAILAASPDLLYLCDRGGRLLGASEPLAALLGRDRSSFLGRSWDELDPGRAIGRRLGPLQDRTFESGRRVAEDLTLPIAGKTLGCECILTPIRDGAGAVVAALVTLRDRTEARRVEESLRRNRERYRLLAENSTDLISRHDLTGIYLYASPASLPITGYTPEELVGRSAYEFILPEDLASVARLHSRILEGPETATVLCRVRRKDGRPVWLESAVRSVRDARSGDVLEIQCASRDVSSRVWAEDQLRESRALLKAILDNTTSVIYVKDEDGRYMLINRRYGELFGVSEEAMRGRTDADLFDADRAAAFRANDARVLESGEVLEVEELAPHADGLHTYLSVKFPIRDGEGRVIAVGGISTDITPRKRAEDSLRQQTAVLRLVLDSMGDAVLMADEHRKFALFNPAAARMFDLGPESIGQPIRSRPVELYLPDKTTTFPPEDLPLERSLRGEPVNDVEMFVRPRKKPEGVWGLVNGRPILDDEGRPRGAVIVYRDITDRRRSEDRIREQNDRLREAIASERDAHRALKEAESHLIQAEKLTALGQLVAGVAHEINNPLAYVNNNVAVLRRDLTGLLELIGLYRRAEPALAAGAPALLDEVRTLTERLDLEYTIDNLEGLLGRSAEGLRRIQQIVKDLRTFARLDEQDLKEVDLNEGIVTTLNIIRGRAKALEIALVDDLAPLPRVTCVAGKVHQVVMNLVSNAIDACKAGGRVTVRSRPDPLGDGVEIRVIDDGQGIDPAVLPRIFDPFFTTKPVGKGTGLGLSISYGIVREHGGAIEVFSRPGTGSEFVVRLPLHPPPEATPSRPITTGSPGPPPTPS